ncbi:DUF6207 family protein [Streptomyces sp. NPDC055506]
MEGAPAQHGVWAGASRRGQGLRHHRRRRRVRPQPRLRNPAPRPALRRTTRDHPGRHVVETAARDESASSFFREALAACWEMVVADRTARGADRHDVRLRYLLDRRPTEPTSCR